MINELIELMRSQEEELKRLLELLEIQYNMIMSKDTFGLEGLVDKIDDCGKEIAKKELQRRNVIGDKSIRDFVNNSNNNQLKEVYSLIQNTLQNVLLKKETNDTLLKQQIMFNNKILQMLNPSRESKIYNSYGSITR
ncbi:flagellar export chaperone FlgN [uncultured Clostridium sp.]|uniref:flagellar export chaperone FlgN n=1 Tax=uncultured Clostridium sp. TaxID=59620 RepID=UPI0028EE870A|nr:flagellar export chaperone FlgN [uncultured Clostridium sp.]